MKTFTKILLCLFIFTLGTSSSNPKGQIKKKVFVESIYNLDLDKSKLISKDEYLLKSLDSLEKKYVKLIKLKKEVVSLRDLEKQ